MTVRLRRVLRRRLREELFTDPLPGPAGEMLSLVGRKPGLRIGDAAKALVVAPNTASTLAAHLIELGLVERQADPDDRRVARLTLTKAGAERLDVRHDRRDAILAEALEQLSPADRQAIEAALEGFGHLVEAVDPRKQQRHESAP